MTRDDAPASVCTPALGHDQKIADIQVLRGISILLVLLQHLSLTAAIFNHAPTKLQMPFYMGVEIFFIISGYVITRTLMKDDFNAVRFVVRRVFRLMPAMLVFLGLWFLLNLVPSCAFFYAEYESNGFSTPWNGFFRHAASILCGYFLLVPGTKPYVTGPMWSLSVEDQFYGAMALLCLLIGLVLRRRASVVAACVLWLSVALYASILAIRIGVLSGAHMGSRVPGVMVYLASWRFDFLALGIILAFAEKRLKGKICAWFRDSGPFVVPWLIMIPLWVVAMCESPFDANGRVLYGLGYPLSGLFFLLLVALASNSLAFPASRGPVYRAMVYLGDRSYTLYLFHFPVFVIAWLTMKVCLPWAMASGGRFCVMQALLTAGVLFPLCHAIYKYVELPCVRLGKRLTRVEKRGPSEPGRFQAEPRPDRADEGAVKRAA